MEYETYRELLKEELERRKITNSAYSLRSFARDLEMSAPRLSQVLNGKQGLSIEAAKEVSKKLRLTEEDTEWFCSSVGALHARSFRERNGFGERIDKLKKNSKTFSELQLEYFEVISEWYYFAILELTYVEGFQNSPRWISNVLGISKEKVVLAIQRMKKLGLIQEQSGNLTDSFKFLATPNDIPSKALRKFHSQILRKASEALINQNVNEREIASNIFSIDRRNVSKIKKEMRSFRRKLEQESSKAKRKNAVYCLSMQFFNISNLP